MNFPADPEIITALENYGVQARSIIPVSNIVSSEIDRIACRIDHENGTIKARRFENESVARELFDFRCGLSKAFAPVIFHYARVILEEWIQGKPLSNNIDNHILKEAGTLLGQLHAGKAWSQPQTHRVIKTAELRLTAEKFLEGLGSCGVLETTETRTLIAAMRRLSPKRALYGPVHFDFCGENMVLDDSGRLIVIDNERMGFNALELDLARTWYRWDLSESNWNTFYYAYNRIMQLSEASSAFVFWRIVAVSRAASLRIRVCPDCADVPLKVLKKLAAEASL